MYTVECPPRYRVTRKTLGQALRYAAELRARLLTAGQDEPLITIDGLPVDAYADQARTSHIPISAENAPERFTRRVQGKD